MDGEVVAWLVIALSLCVLVTIGVVKLLEKKPPAPSPRWRPSENPTTANAASFDLDAFMAELGPEPTVLRGPNGRIILTEHPLPEPYEVLLHYRDSKGKITERPVTAIKLDYQSFSDGGIEMVHIGGHCHVRDRYRTFKKDRIIEAYDGLTGEALADPLRDVLARSLAAYEAKQARPAP